MQSTEFNASGLLGSYTNSPGSTSRGYEDNWMLAPVNAQVVELFRRRMLALIKTLRQRIDDADSSCETEAEDDGSD